MDRLVGPEFAARLEAHPDCLADLRGVGVGQRRHGDAPRAAFRPQRVAEFEIEACNAAHHLVVVAADQHGRAVLALAVQRLRYTALAEQVGDLPSARAFLPHGGQQLGQRPGRQHPGHDRGR